MVFNEKIRNRTKLFYTSGKCSKKKKKIKFKNFVFYFFIVDSDVVKILKALTFATRELYNFTDWKELCAKFDTVVWDPTTSRWETHKVQYLLRRFWQNNYTSKPVLQLYWIHIFIKSPALINFGCKVNTYILYIYIT